MGKKTLSAISGQIDRWIERYRDGQEDIQIDRYKDRQKGRWIDKKVA